MSFRASASTPGSGWSEFTSSRCTTASTTARAVRVVCLMPRRRPGSSRPASDIQQIIASNSPRAAGRLALWQIRSPREMSRASDRVTVTDSGGRADSTSSPPTCTPRIVLSSPDGSTVTGSPGRRMPPATTPA